MPGTSPFLPNLPDDHYGVIVENDMDARRLLYLVEQIGVEKLIASVLKNGRKYPDSQPFVSTLLKRHRVKVPVSVYAPVNVPIYRVYILVHTASSKLKIGYSGNWLNRLQSFSHDYSFTGFDLDRSVGFNFHGDKRAAMDAEAMAKRTFHDARTTAPECVPFGAYGHYEWFRAEIYNDAAALISGFGSPGGRDSMSVRKAIILDMRDEEPDPYFDNLKGLLCV